MRETLKVQDARPWSDRHCLHGIAPTRLREIEVIDLCYLKHCLSVGDEHFSRIHDIYLDVSQSIARMRFRTSRVPTILRSSKIYSYTHDRCLFTADFLSLSGHPFNALEGIPDEQARCLVGEAIPVQMCGTICFAVLKLVSFSDIA